MNRLTLYIGKNILISIGLVLTLLVGLEFIFSLVNEVRHVGTGDYTTQGVLLYIALSLPQLIAEMFPMSALVGTLLGLGLMASRSELIVMRSAGMSIADIIIAVLKLAVILAAFAWAMGEWVAPLTHKLAHQQKSTAMSGGQALRTLHGTWMRDGDDFIHIQTMHAGGHLEGVTRYEFNAEMGLIKASFARFADYAKDHWVLHQIKETAFHKDSISHQEIKKQDWQSSIDPEVLTIVGVKDLAELSMAELWQTMHYRRDNELDSKPYQLAFWQKVVRPVATLVMMFLAIPFVFGPLRSATMGLRMLVGVLVGFTFYTFNQLFGPLTLVYQMPPILGAMLPTLLFLGLGLVGLKRAR